jgi:hypothetical protein
MVWNGFHCRGFSGWFVTESQFLVGRGVGRWVKQLLIRQPPSPPEIVTRLQFIPKIPCTVSQPYFCSFGATVLRENETYPVFCGPFEIDTLVKNYHMPIFLKKYQFLWLWESGFVCSFDTISGKKEKHYLGGDFKPFEIDTFVKN